MREYEREKARIEETAQTYEEYQERIRELAKRLGV